MGLEPGSEFEQRKLAAIMFTDMVGYTALSQRSETLALELLEEHRALLRPLFPRFGGHEIKTIGDGFLVEFASALEAARCAIEMQRVLAQRNLLASPERQVRVRIGIHVGDIVHREGDVLGDGVNIASRIEPLAEPGGICISVDVAHQIQHNLEAAVVAMGQAHVKNVQVPLEICRIVLPWEKAAAATAGGEFRRPGRWSIPLVLSTLVLLLAIAGLISWLATHGRATRPSRPEAGARPSRLVAEQGKSVAVLPFANLGPDKADDYLGDGLTEELINVLVRIPGLRVPARTSAFVFKERKEDIRRIGELLNVQTVLEGSLRKSGNRIRVTAQLINVADGFHLWSETYDRELGDLFFMQQDIARQITERLRLGLSAAAQEQLARRPTQNPEAHELYLKGLYWWNKRTKTGMEQALQFFHGALDRDPAYAKAQAAVAACYVVMPEYSHRPSRECIPKAQAAATRALTLDPSLAEAQAVLAMSKRSTWEWSAAVAGLRTAISMSPNYATAHHWCSGTLRIQGKMEEAMQEIRLAQELDPLSLIIQANISDILSWSGHYDQAILECRKGLEQDPSFATLHRVLGTAYLHKGMLAEARAEFERVRELVSGSPYGLGLQACALGRAGQRAEALQVIARLDEFGRQGYGVALEKAYAYLGLGDQDKTYQFLEESWRAGDELVGAVYAMPLWQELRSDARFAALLKKINLGP